MSEDTPASPPRRRGLPLLRVVTEIRREELLVAALMLLTLFLILAGYYVLRTVREPLILLSGTDRIGGAELRSYSAAGQALLLMFAIPFYSWLASRVSAFRLVLGVSLFFVFNIQLFYLAGLYGLPWIGVAFFIWVGVFNLAIIAQFWSFANDLYSEEAGRRIFPFIAIGATAGAPVGAKVAELLSEAGTNMFAMMQITSVVLVICALLLLWIHRLEARRRVEVGTPTARPLALRGGFRLALGSPYLRWIVVITVLFSLVNQNGNYILSRVVLDAAVPVVDAGSFFGAFYGEFYVRNMQALQAPQAGAFIGAFYGNFYFWVNMLTLLTQMLLVSRLVRWLGPAGLVLILPIVSLGAYALIAAGAGLAIVRWAKTAENTTNYSVMNTARALIWLPTSREEKYSGKLAIDTFFVRAGGLLSAGVVFVGTGYWAFELRHFALVNVGLALIWIFGSWQVIRHYRKVRKVRQAERDAEDAAEESA